MQFDEIYESEQKCIPHLIPAMVTYIVYFKLDLTFYIRCI